MPVAHRTAAEVAQESLRLLLAHDMNTYADLWAEDGVFELPFAPPGQPAVVQGREALRTHLAGYADLLDVQDVQDVVIHEGLDPDRAVVEFTASGRVVPTGRAYRLAYIAVLRTHQGEVVSYRDYWDPQAAGGMLTGADTSGAAFAPKGAR